MIVEVCVPKLAEGIFPEQKAIESNDFIYNLDNSYIIQLMHVDFEMPRLTECAETRNASSKKTRPQNHPKRACVPNFGLVV